MDHKILHYLRKIQKIYIGMLNNHINYTFIHKKKIKKLKKKTKNYLHQFNVITVHY